MKKRPAPEMGDDIVRHSKKLEITESLGFKAGLAYSSTFYFVCRKNGMERKYAMYEGESGNTIDLIHDSPTTERNGVKMIIPVKTYDVNTFKSKTKEQLAYFESVYFDVDGIPNDFKIIRHDDFQWSQLSQNNYIHICLDNVYYQLDYSKVGLSGPVHFPVALRFNLSDGIFPTPNRESIRYTRDTQKIIMDKLAKVSDFFVSLYNASVTETDDVRSVFEYYSDDHRYVNFHNLKLDVSKINNYSSISMAQPKIKGLKLIDIKRIVLAKDFIFREYSRLYRYYNSRFHSEERRANITPYYVIKDKKVAICSSALTVRQKDYLREKWQRTDYYIIKKDTKIPLKSQNNNGAYSSYYNILELKKYPKSEWRQRIVDLQNLIKMFVKDFEVIDDNTVPSTWVSSKKRMPVSKVVGGGAKTKRVKLDGEVTIKMAQDLERTVGNNSCKFVPTVVQMNNFHRRSFLTVYGKDEHRQQLDELYGLFHKKHVVFGIVSEKQYEVLNGIKVHNLMNVEEFVKGKNKVYKRMVTSLYINKLMNQYTYVFSRSYNLRDFSTSLGEKVIQLSIYHDRFLNNNSSSATKQRIMDNTTFDMIDSSIVETYVYVKKTLEKLYFLNAVFQHHYRVDKPTERLICDLFKYHKYRLNLSHYKISQG